MLSLRSRFRNAGANPLAKDLVFELRKYRQQPCHRAAWARLLNASGSDVTYRYVPITPCSGIVALALTSLDVVPKPAADQFAGYQCASRSAAKWDVTVYSLTDSIRSRFLRSSPQTVLVSSRLASGM